MPTKKIFGLLIVLFVLLAATQFLSPQVAHAQCGLPGTPPCGGEREKKNRPTPTSAPTPIPTAPAPAVITVPILPPLNGKVGHADNVAPAGPFGFLSGNGFGKLGALILVMLIGGILIGRRFQHSGGTHSGATDNSTIPGDNMGWKPGDQNSIPGDNMGWKPGDQNSIPGDNMGWKPGDQNSIPGDNMGWKPGDQNSIPGDNMLGNNTFGGAGNSPTAREIQPGPPSLGGAGNSPTAVERDPGPISLGGAGNSPTAVEGSSLPPPDADLPSPTNSGH